MSSMSFHRTQSQGRPISSTLSGRPVSSGANVRRPVTAVDFGETTVKTNVSVTSKGSAVETANDDNWFPEHTETSVCLVVGSDESDDESEMKEKTSEETLRDMVLTANEYFQRSATESANWWE